MAPKAGLSRVIDMKTHDAQPSPLLLTVDQAAATLAVTPAAVRKWVWQRRMPAVRVGRLLRLRQADVARVATDGLPPR